MAVGARQSDILQQFLIEAVLVCILGGILGVLLSLGIGQLIGHIAKAVSKWRIQAPQSLRHLYVQP